MDTLKSTIVTPRSDDLATGGLAVCALAFALIGGCGPIPSSADSAAAAAPKAAAPATEAAAPTTVETLMGDWTLTNLNGQSIDTLLPADMKRPSITFAKDGTVSGFAGVNRISAKTDAGALASGKIDLATIISTKMAGPEPAMKLEHAFVSALSRCKFIEPTSPTSMRLTDGTATLLTFSKAAK